jgi:hypothetical protein
VEETERYTGAEKSIDRPDGVTISFLEQAKQMTSKPRNVTHQMMRVLIKLKRIKD